MKLELRTRKSLARMGLKGPQAAEWLVAHDIPVPAEPNSWLAVAAGSATAAQRADSLLVARLGSSEFFLEEGGAGATLVELEAATCEHPRGVYPVLREDAAFELSGEGAENALAQVCNVNFSELRLDARPVVMTLMIGVAVLIVPLGTGGPRSYRIWCDPTYGAYLRESLGEVVAECGGMYGGESA